MTLDLQALADPTQPVAGGLDGKALIAAAREHGGESVPALKRLLEIAPLRVAAIEALGLVKSPEAAALLDVYADSADRNVRKTARQSLHRLRSAGVVYERPASDGSEPSPYIRAGMSYFAPGYTQIVWLAVRGKMGAVREGTAVWNPVFGLEGCHLHDLAKSPDARYAELVAGHPDEQPPYPQWAEIPGEYALHLIRRAMALNTEIGYAAPPSLPEFAQLLATPDPYEEPLIYQHVRKIEAKLDPTMLERSYEILDEPELRHLQIGDRAVEMYRQEAMRLRDTPMLVGDVPMQDRVRMLVQKAHREIFTPALRRVIRTALEETAYIFWTSNRLLSARRAVAVAVALAERPDIETPITIEMMGRALFGRQPGVPAGQEPDAPRPSGLWVPR